MDVSVGVYTYVGKCESLIVRMQHLVILPSMCGTGTGTGIWVNGVDGLMVSIACEKTRNLVTSGGLVSID